MIMLVQTGSAANAGSVRDFALPQFVAIALNSYLLGRPSVPPARDEICWETRPPDRNTDRALTDSKLAWEQPKIDEDLFERIRELQYWPYRCQLVQRRDAINGQLIRVFFGGLTNARCRDFSTFLARFIKEKRFLEAYKDLGARADLLGPIYQQPLKAAPSEFDKFTSEILPKAKLAVECEVVKPYVIFDRSALSDEEIFERF